MSSEITDALDASFMESSSSDTSFEESFAKFKGYQKKPTYESKRNEERKYLKKAKLSIEEQNRSSCVNRALGGDMSMREWNAHRKRTSMITVVEARKLSEEKKQKELSGKKQKKDHVGNLSAYDIKIEEIVKLSGSWTSNTVVNFTDIGKFFFSKNGDTKKCRSNSKKVVV